MLPLQLLNAGDNEDPATGDHQRWGATEAWDVVGGRKKKEKKTLSKKIQKKKKILNNTAIESLQGFQFESRCRRA